MGVFDARKHPAKFEATCRVPTCKFLSIWQLYLMFSEGSILSSLRHAKYM